MNDLLKGNFKTKNEVKIKEILEPSLEERFEREALKKLGGSIAYVSKRRVMWNKQDFEKGKLI
jgi:hypothetical protein